MSLFTINLIKTKLLINSTYRSVSRIPYLSIINSHNILNKHEYSKSKASFDYALKESYFKIIEDHKYLYAIYETVPLMDFENEKAVFIKLNNNDGELFINKTFKINNNDKILTIDIDKMKNEERHNYICLDTIRLK
jgi:hypothetical protein